MKKCISFPCICSSPETVSKQAKDIPVGTIVVVSENTENTFSVQHVHNKKSQNPVWEEGKEEEPDCIQQFGVTSSSLDIQIVIFIISNAILSRVKQEHLFRTLGGICGQHSQYPVTVCLEISIFFPCRGGWWIGFVRQDCHSRREEACRDGFCEKLSQTSPAHWYQHSWHLGGTTAGHDWGHQWW